MNKHFAAPLFLLLGCLTLPAAFAAPVDDLLARAETAQLWTNRYWQTTLLHGETSLTGWKSRIDDPAFFLASNGRTDPQAELRATLAAFFQPVPAEEKQHAVYRFPARLHWLKQQLHWDGAGLPMQEARKFREVYDYLRPASIAMVYPAAYMNSPASMFGHTMIVFDAKDHNRLLSQALTYAAQTDESFGPFFAIEGIFGFYKGYYSALPYYEKVEEYTAIGHRDVWEYELNFTQEEIDQMFRHAWELQNIYSYYYFFTENCSFNLFYLLDAARPSLHTTDYARWFVIPVDTVKFIDDQGIVRNKVFRPSQVSRIRYLAANLPPERRDAALAVARGTMKPADLVASISDPQQRTRALDLASEFTQYLYTSRELPVPEYRPRFLSVLRERSKLGAGEDVAASVPMPDRPEEGHAAGRVVLSSGVSDGDFFTSIHLRPAYHGATDNDHGFTRGAQIEFLNLELRHIPEHERVELRNVDLVEVASLSPRDALFHPYSWKVKGGLTQSDAHEGQDRLMAHFDSAFGRTWRTGADGIVFGLVETEAVLGRDLDDGYGLASGPSIGLIQNLTPRWKVSAAARMLGFYLGDNFWWPRITLDQDVLLRRNLSVGLELRYERFDENDIAEAQARLKFYF